MQTMAALIFGPERFAPVHFMPTKTRGLYSLEDEIQPRTVHARFSYSGWYLSIYVSIYLPAREAIRVQIMRLAQFALSDTRMFPYYDSSL
jgi:hypothetical protein